MVKVTSTISTSLSTSTATSTSGVVATTISVLTTTTISAGASRKVPYEPYLVIPPEADGAGPEEQAEEGSSEPATVAPEEGTSIDP